MSFSLFGIGGFLVGQQRLGLVGLTDLVVQTSPCRPPDVPMVTNYFNSERDFYGRGKLSYERVKGGAWVETLDRTTFLIFSVLRSSAIYSWDANVEFSCFLGPSSYHCINLLRKYM